MSTALELFNRIVNSGYSAVEELINQSIPESDILEYKTSSFKNGDKGLPHDDRKNLGKTLSAFSNGSGGCIVWGVDCRVIADRADVPTEIKPIPNCKKFQTLLDSAIGTSTTPVCDGVQTASITQNDQSGGVVIMHVPEGINVPYKSSTDGSKDYYLRSGSSIFPVPHTILASMFGRKPLSAIRPFMLLNSDGSMHSGTSIEHIIDLEIYIKNYGKGFARDPYFTFDCRFVRSVNTLVDDKSWLRINNINPETYVPKDKSFIIPPNCTIKVFNIKFPNYSSVEQSGMRFAISTGDSNGPGFTQKYVFSKEGVKQINELSANKFSPPLNKPDVWRKTHEIYMNHLREVDAWE